MNRLLAYVERGLGEKLAKKQMKHLAAMADALHAAACKGVHADVDQQETEQTLMWTYLVLADVARAYGAAAP